MLIALSCLCYSSLNVSSTVRDLKLKGMPKYKQVRPRARNYRGKGREVSPALFRKLEKSSPILGKNALIVVIRGLSFSFKLQFLRVRGRKNWKFFPAGLFFLVLWMIVFQSALMIPRKLPCSKKFLAASLDLDTQIFLPYVVNLPRIL